VVCGDDNGGNWTPSGIATVSNDSQDHAGFSGSGLYGVQIGYNGPGWTGSFVNGTLTETAAQNDSSNTTGYYTLDQYSGQWKVAGGNGGESGGSSYEKDYGEATGAYSQDLGWIDTSDCFVAGTGGENGHDDAFSSYNADLAPSGSGQWAVADGTAQSGSISVMNTLYSGSGAATNVCPDNELLNHGTQSGWSQATTAQCKVKTAANGSWVQTASSSSSETKSEDRYSIYTTGGSAVSPCNENENQDLFSDVVASNGQSSANSWGSGNDYAYITFLSAPGTSLQWQDQWSMPRGGVNTVSGSSVNTYDDSSESYGVDTAWTLQNPGFGGQAGWAGFHSPGLQPPAVTKAPLSGEMSPPPPPSVQGSVPPTGVQTINPGRTRTAAGAGGFGSLYSYYLTNPSKMDSDLYLAWKVDWAVTGTAAGGAAALSVGPAVMAGCTELGVGSFGASLLTSIVCGKVGSTVGDAVGSIGGPEAGAWASFGGGFIGSFAGLGSAGAEATEAEAAEEALASCFPAGTLVATPRRLFPIETIRIGDEVWAFDLIHSCWTLRKVLKTFVRDYDGSSATITALGEEIEATSLHPFWVITGEDLAGRPIRGHLPRVPEGATTSGRWVDAADVRVGDELLLRDGRIVPVQVVRCQPYHDKVYNVHVEDLQCYAVGQYSVLVHNTNGIEALGEGCTATPPGLSQLQAEHQAIQDALTTATEAGRTDQILTLSQQLLTVVRRINAMAGAITTPN
jgi:hypothetical protein